MKNHNKGTSVFKNFLITAWLAFASLAATNASAATSITALATPSTATVPASVILSISVNADPDPVIITKVEYFNGISPLGESTTAPFSLALGNVAAGTYNIVAKATVANPENPVLLSNPAALVVASGSTGGSNVYYVQTDQLNTPRAITDQSNALVWKWDSDPYGSTPPNEKPGSAASFTYNQRFPGQFFDKETNFHYNYFRDYDPQTGRYVQSDPIGLAGGINTYSYSLGNPVKYTDPTGQFVPLVIAVCAAGGCEAIFTAAVAGAVWWGISHQPMANSSSSDRGLQQAIEKEANRREYKSYCDDPPPPGGNACDNAQNDLRNAQRCKAARDENTKKWWQGQDSQHDSRMMTDLNNRISNAEKAVKRSCPSTCQ